MLLPVIVALFVLPMFAQNARATDINFICGFGNPQACGGVFTATFGGGTATSASASGVTVLNDSGPDQGMQFTMAFNTGTSTFTLTEIGGPDILNGTITAILSGSQLPGQDILTLSVSFASLPADFAAFLGTQSGSAANTDIYIQGGTGVGTIVNIVSTPEPATLWLFGSGLLGLGGLVRRKQNV